MNNPLSYTPKIPPMGDLPCTDRVVSFSYDTGRLVQVPLSHGETMESCRDWKGLNLRSLAEAIILQAIEDLWDADHMGESLEFFSGDEFERYLGMAEIDDSGKLRLLGLIHIAPKERALCGPDAADGRTSD